MKIYKGESYYCPPYEENIDGPRGTKRRPGVSRGRRKMAARAQPYRDRQGTAATREQMDFARWVNVKRIFWKVSFEDYRGRV